MRFRVVAVIAAAAVAVGVSGTAASADVKIVNGWNTLPGGQVEQGNRTYCVQMKTIAQVDDAVTLATGKAKVRVLKSKLALCDKRVNNLNVLSTTDVTIGDDTPVMEDDCYATATNAVFVVGTKLLKAVVSSADTDCLMTGFTVFGDTHMLVGNANKGALVTVDSGQSGPSFVPGP
jgi:hypothetical protein